MILALRNYYDERGIGALEFRCPHATSCRGAGGAFTTAKESFVGPEYEKGTLPRLLLLSLDSGSGHPRPADRTLEAVRRQELAERVPARVSTAPPLRPQSHAAPLRRPTHRVLPKPLPRLWPPTGGCLVCRPTSRSSSQRHGPCARRRRSRDSSGTCGPACPVQRTRTRASSPACACSVSRLAARREPAAAPDGRAAACS
jgi:hypothetical protein